MSRHDSVTPPRWLEKLVQWEQANYDGIKGEFPYPLPKYLDDKFRSTQLFLFHLVTEGELTYAEIKSRFDLMTSDKYARLAVALSDDRQPYDDGLFFLADLYTIVSLDEAERSKLLEGEDAVSGKKVRQGGKLGHEKAHGNESEKKQRWAKCQAEVDSVHKEYPSWGITDVRKEAARRIGVSTKMLQRHTRRSW